MITIETDAVLCVPPEIRLCPYCGSKMSVSFTAWSQCEDGTWEASDIELECDNEPELHEDGDTNTEAWDEWFAVHSEMPYVYWLPAQLAVEEWVNKHYRFRMKENKNHE